jgi:hypothetical protein
MRRSMAAGVLAATALLCACDMDRHRNNTSDDDHISAEGKAESGRISIKAPGVDLSIVAPRELAGAARAGRESKVIYPGSSVSGVAIAASQSKGQGGDTDVEARFQSADPPEKVLAWYRDPARDGDFRLAGIGRDHKDYLVSGHLRHDAHPFRVRLSPGRGGGTEGRLNVHHSD